MEIELFQNLLGYIYEEKREFITAVEWYKKSAAQKKAGAQFNIGRLYDKRYGKHSGITANDDTAKMVLAGCKQHR